MCLLLFIVVVLPANSIATHNDANMPKYKLTYFDAKGSAELSRILMKIGDIEFTDNRLPILTSSSGNFEANEYWNRKNDGDFSMNMDRLPVLEIDEDLIVGQSKAIERYIALKCNMFGDNDEERAVIDCITENVRDIKEKYATIRRAASLLNDATQSTAKVDFWLQNDLPDWLEKLERSLPLVLTAESSDYAVGNNLSLADVSIWHLVCDYFCKDISSTIQLNGTKGKCARLGRIACKVAEQAVVQKWLQERPNTIF